MTKGKSTPMTSDAASRIQSATAKSGDGGVSKGSFAAKAQSAAATNANAAAAQGGGAQGGSKK
jgi:hypothetical protein|eukprot:3865-Heterococcus_DN1.PRE.2